MKTKRLSKKRLLEVKAELAEIKEAKTKLTHRENELRNAIADFFHEGDDGTENFEVHGHQVKVQRKMNLSITKGNLVLLEEEEPELFAARMESAWEEVERSLQQLDKTFHIIQEQVTQLGLVPDFSSRQALRHSL